MDARFRRATHQQPVFEIPGTALQYHGYFAEVIGERFQECHPLFVEYVESMDDLCPLLVDEDYRFSVMSFVGVVLLISLGCGHAARILGIFPSPMISHQLPFQVIMKALAARGHQVTVISPHPQKIPIANYTDIDVSDSLKLASEWKFHELEKMQPVDTMTIFNYCLSEIIDFQLGSPQIQALIKNNDTRFDLVIIERVSNQAFFGLIHQVGSPPVVGVLSLGGMAISYNNMGNPFNPSYLPDTFSPYSDHMSFWKRFYNAYVCVKIMYVWRSEVLPGQEALLRKYFGSAPPSVYETEYNDSLLLLNNHWSLSYPRPLLPNVVELTGLHVQTTTKPLPKDIKSFLDGAEHGVIYFSLGSNVKSVNLPQEKVQHILDAFSEVPQRVLWKWESDSLPGKPSNVMIRKWLPQQDVLAHPNIRVFITQGGLQSFQEAAYHGVPLIGIPFLGDQFYNVAKFEAAKIGVQLKFKDLTKDTLLEVIEKLTNDSSYRDNMKTFSAVYREEVGPSLDRAIWWIEYVLRHNGAPHLRSAALDLSWYQYLLLDVIAFLLLVSIIALIVIYIVLRRLMMFVKSFIPSSKLKSS
ncbi:UDP-glucosyltransferase 2-like [Anabrus simplex]|uniref:UDP-glucosyltransferase 2-like n=1 Tax=Anabrus simplex TaxID=316456 RepID=UPI0035A39CDB